MRLLCPSVPVPGVQAESSSLGSPRVAPVGTVEMELEPTLYSVWPYEPHLKRDLLYHCVTWVGVLGQAVFIVLVQRYFEPMSYPCAAANSRMPDASKRAMLCVFQGCVGFAFCLSLLPDVGNCKRILSRTRPLSHLQCDDSHLGMTCDLLASFLDVLSQGIAWLSNLVSLNECQFVATAMMSACFTEMLVCVFPMAPQG